MQRHSLGLVLWWVLPTLIVFFIGFAHLAGPFTGDQALYAFAGQSIINGDVMYRDFVDIKHPGVHHYYALGIWLFSSLVNPEMAVHILELGVWLVFGLFVQYTLKSRLTFPSLAALAPIALGGAYYSTVGPGGLTQVEALPGPLICFGIWLSCRASSRGNGIQISSFLAGIILSVIVIFHGHMIGVAIALIVLAGIRHGTLLPLVAGFSLFIATFCLYFFSRGAWPGLWEAYISYPIAANIEVPAEPGGFLRIRWNLSNFVYDFAPWIVLAGFIVLRLPRFVKDTFAAQHLLWGGVALVTMLLETRTSWPFHFLYYVVPLGVIAVYGVDSLASMLGRHGRTVAAIVGFAALIPAMFSHWMHLGDKQHSIAAVNDQMILESEFLREPGAIEGPIYVFGSPVLQLVSERGQALPRNGWGWEVALKSHWDILPSNLQTAKPAYVHVSTHYDPMIWEKAPGVMQLLHRDYEAMPVQSDGKWYALQQ